MPAHLQFLTPPDVRHACETALARLTAARAVSRLWERDLTLWPDTAGTRESVRDRLGWLDAPEISAAHTDRMTDARAHAVADGVSHVVLLGMGGSSLAPAVIAHALTPGGGGGALRMLDSLSPAAIRRTFAGICRALVIVASKSGSTVEPHMLALEARRQIEAAGISPWAHRFVAVTDPGTRLAEAAMADGFGDLWLNPPDIGGRFSALSLFGLVPPALAGLQVGDLLASGRNMAEHCRTDNAATNPGAVLGAYLAACAAVGRPAVSLILSPRLERFGLWVEQLVAESTGKEGLGVLPVMEAPLRASRGHRAAVIVELIQEPADAGVIDALTASGTPVARITLATPAGLGGEFFRWEFATTVCGWLMGVNPFDQPDVQSTKSATEALLVRFASDRVLPEPPVHATVGGLRIGCTTAVDIAADLAAQLTAPEAPYVAVLAYADPDDPEIRAVLQAVVERLGSRTGAPVTLGFGPRYLHSTGQLHKGGSPGARYLIASLQPVDDLAIPEQVYSFGTLQLAQARADLAALGAAGRHAVLAEVTGGAVDLDVALRTLIP